jgi:hypothetical protein
LLLPAKNLPPARIPDYFFMGIPGWMMLELRDYFKLVKRCSWPGGRVKELSHACRSTAVALALAMPSSGALGMTAPAAPSEQCQVTNGAKLPAASGGSAALCAAIQQAAEARGKHGTFTVRVSVGPRSRLTAYVTLADGRSLPPLHLASMDRAIGKATLERFGAAVADHVAGATR